MLVVVGIFGLTDFLFAGYTVFAKSVAADKLRIAEWQWLLNRAIWRIVVGLAAVVLGILLIQPIHWVTTAEQTSLTQLSFAINARNSILAAILWALIYHLIVVLLRLYTYRPRLRRRKA